MKDKKDKLTIGIFIDSFFPMIDGVIMVVDNTARRLSKYANVIVFAPFYPGKEYDDSKLPYKVVRCKAKKMHIIDYSMPMPDLDKEFKKELKNYNLDVVHIHSPFMIGRLGVKYAQKHNIPSVGTMHSQILQDFKRAVKDKHFAKGLTSMAVKIYNQCTECWAVNQDIAYVYHDEYGYKKMPIVIQNATEMKPVNEKKAARHIEERHNIKPTDKVFLFVGRLNALKNIFFIVDALKIFKKNNPNIKFKMIYVGDGQDEEKLRSHIRKEGMSKEIVLAGRITDRELLAEYYSRADLFLFPSLYDTSSLVQIEAACHGTPTIFLEGAVTAGTVTPEVNGILSINDVNEYAHNIERMMTDKLLYKKISHNAKKDLYKNWDDVVGDMYKRYLYLIEENEKDLNSK